MSNSKIIQHKTKNQIKHKWEKEKWYLPSNTINPHSLLCNHCIICSASHDLLFVCANIEYVLIQMEQSEMQDKKNTQTIYAFILKVSFFFIFHIKTFWHNFKGIWVCAKSANRFYKEKKQKQKQQSLLLLQP